jgi:hypothetical protein
MPARAAESRDFRDSFFIRFPHLWNSGNTELLANQPVTRLLSLITMREGNLFHPGCSWEKRGTCTLTGLGAGFEV